MISRNEAEKIFSRIDNNTARFDEVFIEDWYDVSRILHDIAYYAEASYIRDTDDGVDNQDYLDEMLRLSKKCHELGRDFNNLYDNPKYWL